jgi:putative peptide zinc metalloprotease protein
MNLGSATSAPPPTACPRLRSDLRVTVDSDGAFIIEDPVSSQFHRVGTSEYALLSQLDGRTTLTTAAAKAAPGGIKPPLVTRQLELFGQWLAATNLLATSASPPAAKSAPAANPCYIKVPITAGGGTLDYLTTAFGWLFTWPAMIAIAFLSLIATCQIALHWTSFTSSASRILCPDQHLLLAACWLFLKLAHELGHGIASRRLGGGVREFGVAIIFFMPVPYSDVTSSWRCPREARMIIAAAGMYFEWIIALAAVAIWSATSNAAVQQACVYVVGLATLTTILFNANPLCRMDGYYLLSDFCGLQNLAAQGQRVSRAWLSWLLLGQAPAEATASKHRFAIGCYGLLARLWRTLSLVTMALLVVLIYEGLGLLFLGSIVLAWHLQTRSATPAQPTASAPPRAPRGRLALRIALIAGLIGLGLWLTPWPGGMTAPGAVENVERYVVHAPCDAQVVEILVNNGDRVAAGQEIARLRSEKLTLELAELESAYAQGEVKQRSQRTKKQLVDWQVEEHRQDSLRERIEQCRQKLDNLTLRAPTAGHVIARRIADLPGSYLAEGAEVCSVVSREQEFRVLIAERDLAVFRSHVGKQLDVSLVGRSVRGVLERLEPAASTSATDTNLGANAGGPLPVMPEPNAAWRLKEPRIVGHVRFVAPDTSNLFPGQRGYVSVVPPDYSLGERLASACRAWLDKLSAQARQRTITNQSAIQR